MVDSHQVLTTACSCSGAPTIALADIVGNVNFVEIAAAEKHVLGLVVGFELQVVTERMFWICFPVVYLVSS